MSKRRRELIAIAANLFADRGFANVTVDEIGDAAGVSGPALYHHFAGKEALLGEMLIGISDYLLEGGRNVITASGDDALRRLIAFHATFAVDDRALIAVQFRDLVHATEADRHTVRTLQAKYVMVWVNELIRLQPDLDRRTARSAVQAAFGLINSTPHSGSLPREQMIDLLSRMALAALQNCRPVGVPDSTT